MPKKRRRQNNELDPIGLAVAIILSAIFLGYFFQFYDKTVFWYLGLFLLFGLALFLIFINSSQFSKQKIPTSERIKSDDSRYIPSEVKIEVWKRDLGQCVICGSQHHLEYDHIIPVSKGGSNTANNIRILCRNCNREKSDKIQ